MCLTMQLFITWFGQELEHKKIHLGPSAKDRHLETLREHLGKKKKGLHAPYQQPFLRTRLRGAALFQIAPRVNSWSPEATVFEWQLVGDSLVQPPVT